MPAHPQDGTPPDPIAIIRGLVARTEYADAAEAITGLPAPMQDREWAMLHFQTFSLRASRAAAERVLVNDPDDAEILRVIGDLDFTEGRYSSARQRYGVAARVLASDPRFSDTEREAELSTLTGREAMLRSAEDYRALGTAAEERSLNASMGLTAVVAIMVLTGVLWGRRARSGK